MSAEKQDDVVQDGGMSSPENPTSISYGTVEDDGLADLTGGKAMLLGILFMLLGCLFWAWFAYVSASRISMLGVVVVGWMTGFGVKRAAVGLGPQFMAAFIAAVGIPIGLAFVTIAIKIFIEGLPWEIEGIIGETRRVFVASLRSLSTLAHYLVCIGAAFMLPADRRSTSPDRPAVQA